MAMGAAPRAELDRLMAQAPALRRLAVIGNALPRRCGIATFTTDLHRALSVARPTVQTGIVAMTDAGHHYDYPPIVNVQIRETCLSDYRQAADVLNAARIDLVSLQHEFGIFGGEAGGAIVGLLERLTMPVVTTLHTVLKNPTRPQRRVLEAIVSASGKVIVMAEKGRALLQTVYGVAADKITVIPHGIPDVRFSEPEAAKQRCGFAGQMVILTFGLLSPNKGIEVMIEAMPAILKNRPDALYVILGATHPTLVRNHGETYRHGLMDRVQALGLTEHVVFLDQFVDYETLLDFIAACDVYVTPYLNEAQMTSGTLAYSFGLGKAVVSTPYWHAEELLAEGRGVLVPFGDSAALSREISDLLTDDARRQALRTRAYADSRSMTWERTAERYWGIFDAVPRAPHLTLIAQRDEPPLAPEELLPPDMRLGYFLSMCDDTGLFQHAVHSIPNRAHGYCVDDNARALLLACALNHPAEAGLPEVLTTRFAAFVQDAWNPDTGRFRNFMSFQRQWLEDTGSEDSHGRTLWALGTCTRDDTRASRRLWAEGLFLEALPTVESFASPRAWAFTLLGLDAYCGTIAPVAEAERLRLRLAAKLVARLADSETPAWPWFESGLSYDNARLCQALIVTGIATDTPLYLETGLRTLHWLMTQQTAESGCFRPVGSDTFGTERCAPAPFDQQPVEATAALSACLAAWRAEGDEIWKTQAITCFSWFLGHNDLAVALVDFDTGSCRDGLHRDRPNENRGGESVVSYLLSLAEIRQLVRITRARPTGTLVPFRAAHP
jgi:glycosyltransferase involved in cell wall biosynthesis